jgi:formylglycine-generating enzyme required for sulfatase activity
MDLESSSGNRGRDVKIAARPALARADAFAAGDSYWGVRQMVGNVWEFIDEMATPSPEALRDFKKIMKPPPIGGEPWYAMMGGSYGGRLDPAISYDKVTIPARFSDTYIGFRCVKDAPN